MYKPLPACITIKPSRIHGLGLFATEDIPKGEVLGISHIFDERFENNYIRTPLGGLYNHSSDPNCKGQKSGDGLVWFKAVKDIKKDEELTGCYNLYEVGG